MLIYSAILNFHRSVEYKLLLNLLAYWKIDSFKKKILKTNTYKKEILFFYKYYYFLNFHENFNFIFKCLVAD